MKKIIFALLLPALLSSCSLFKFSVSTGDTPLSPTDLNIRMTTRGFYNEFTNRVITTADSIIASSDNFNIKINALRWKMEATSACASAVFQTIPEVSLLNTWVLCRQIEQTLTTLPDSALFGAQTPLARAASKQLLTKIETLARNTLPTDRHMQMSTFVNNYCSSRTMAELRVMPDNLMLEWINYLGMSDKSFVKTVGAVSEVMADMGERMSNFSQQLGNELSWSKEMIVMQMEQDSIRDRLSMQLDSTARDFRRMVLILEHSPELIEVVSEKLNKQLTSLMETMNYSVDNAFANIERERIALQDFFAEQRALVMIEAQHTADAAVKSALDSLPSVIGKVLVYVILGAIVIFTLPFLLGLWLGQLRERKRKNRQQ